MRTRPMVSQPDGHWSAELKKFLSKPKEFLEFEIDSKVKSEYEVIISDTVKIFSHDRFERNV